jgi:hypothetical protein
VDIPLRSLSLSQAPFTHYVALLGLGCVPTCRQAREKEREKIIIKNTLSLASSRSLLSACFFFFSSACFALPLSFFFLPVSFSHSSHIFASLNQQRQQAKKLVHAFNLKPSFRLVAFSRASGF